MSTLIKVAMHHERNSADALDFRFHCSPDFRGLLISFEMKEKSRDDLTTCSVFIKSCDDEANSKNDEYFRGS